MSEKEIIINIDSEKIAYTISYGKSLKKPTVILLHGAGPFNREKIKYIADYLADNNISTVRLDFSGQGDSSGKMKESSLSKRLNEAIKVIESYKITEPITVIGTSTGGHIASLLTKKTDVKSLILFCPAAYRADAFNVSFNEKFTEMIREKNSYEKSDVFNCLKEYKGKSAIIIGEKDDIIPDKVIHMYNESLKGSSLTLMIKLKDCPHQIHGWFEKNKDQRNDILKIINMISS